MSEILSRFTLEAAKFNIQVFFCLLAIWIVLVFCAIASIKSQGFSPQQQRMWVLVVSCIPLVGILIYLPFSVRKEDLPQILLMLLQRKRMAKKVADTTLTNGERPA